jgi:hypothetical protein
LSGKTSVAGGGGDEGEWLWKAERSFALGDIERRLKIGRASVLGSETGWRPFFAGLSGRGLDEKIAPDGVIGLDSEG